LLAYRSSLSEASSDADGGGDLIASVSDRAVVATLARNTLTRRPVVAHEAVGEPPSAHPVEAGPSVYKVAACVPGDLIVTFFAEEGIGAPMTADDIPPGPAGEAIVASLTTHGIVRSHAEHAVIASPRR